MKTIYLFLFISSNVFSQGLSYSIDSILDEIVLDQNCDFVNENNAFIAAYSFNQDSTTYLKFRVVQKTELDLYTFVCPPDSASLYKGWLVIKESTLSCLECSKSSVQEITEHSEIIFYPTGAVRNNDTVYFGFESFPVFKDWIIRIDNKEAQFIYKRDCDLIDAKSYLDSMKVEGWNFINSRPKF